MKRNKISQNKESRWDDLKKRISGAGKPILICTLLWLVVLIPSFCNETWIKILFALLMLLILLLVIGGLLYRREFLGALKLILKGPMQELPGEMQLPESRSHTVEEIVKEKLDEVEREIEKKQQEIADVRSANRQLEERLKESVKLENAYPELLKFIQRMETKREKYSPEIFLAFIRENIYDAMEDAGYYFEDFKEEEPFKYDWEKTMAVKEPELVYRAIVDAHGEVVLKGKIYLPKEQVEQEG